MEHFEIARSVQTGAKGPHRDDAAAILWSLAAALRKHDVDHVSADDVDKIGDVFDTGDADSTRIAPDH